MAGDLTRDLIVALRSISYSGSSSATLLSSSIDIYIDSTDPNIWLPDEACDAFEKAFGLTLDAKTGLYLVNDTHRNTLLDSNVEVSFRLSDVKSGGEMVTVVLPYAAFDLTAEPPLVEKASYYFPLKRANNSGQYTLGRTFLQEAYLSADYERKVFNVSACVWDQGAQENIVTITSKDSPNSGGGSSSPSKSKISGGTLAGIIVGAILGALFLAAAIAVFILRKRRKWISTGFAVASKRPEPDESVFKDRVFNDDPRQGSTPDSSVPFSADDISASRSTTEFARPASGAISESAAAAAGSTVELDGRDTAVRPNTEIDGHEVQQKPLTPVAESPGGVFELPGSDAAGYGGRGRDLEPRPPSTVGSLPSRDDREGANHSPPSPLTSTFDGNWGVERNSKANSELVSPNHPNYRDGDRPF
ncbi:hypothetical protein B0T25DRAFT_448271 [Lasiosphaeria hispida]|uniref:Peptidase A1 domain-containing protein n=1 Tax=Lasiosphaeria hispida TaxID=260671 RepID=A0AAJ0HSQ6_9PEZI|nr:hypothetical protein B0T25DRAFT_448271 [Lasiosphaeria hispida]